MAEGKADPPMDQHDDIIKCVQGEGESDKAWLIRSFRGAHAHGRKSKKNTTGKFTKEPSRSKVMVFTATPTLIDSDYQTMWKAQKPDIELVATIKQGHLQHTTHEEQNYTPPPVPPKREPPPIHNPDIKL